MSDAARNAFNTQLASVMESLLTAAVCEVTKIFEGSLSDSRVEIARSREEVILLKRQLEVLETLSEGLVKAAPLLEDHLLTKGESGPQEGVGMPRSPQDGLGMPCRVKNELEVTKLEFVNFAQDSVHIKEESVEENLESVPVEGQCFEGRGLEEASPLVPGFIAHSPSALDPSPEVPVEGTLRWMVQLAQLEVPPVAALGNVLHRPLPPRPGRGDFMLGSGVAGGPLGHGDEGPDEPGYRARTQSRPTVAELSEAPFLPDPTHGTAADHARPTGSPLASEVSARETKLLCTGERRGSPAQPGCTPPGWEGGEERGNEGVVRTPIGEAAEQQDANFLRSRCISAPQRYHLSASLSAGSMVAGTHTCPEARHVSVTKGKLKLHLNAYARERPYVCPYCGKDFFYPSQQRRHLLRHTGERLYPCTQCDKSFVTPSELSMHTRVHTGEKPFCCLQCGKRFNRNGNLRAHQRDVHQGKRPFTCVECGKTFSQKGNLRTHQKRLHRTQRHFSCIE